MVVLAESGHYPQQHPQARPDGVPSAVGMLDASHSTSHTKLLASHTRHDGFSAQHATLRRGVARHSTAQACEHNCQGVLATPRSSKSQGFLAQLRPGPAALICTQRHRSKQSSFRASWFTKQSTLCPCIVLCHVQDMPVAQFVVENREAVWLVGPLFAALTGEACFS